MKKVFIILLVMVPQLMEAQIDRKSDLFITLYQYDSLLFDLGFNQCDTLQHKRLISESVVFYHDQSGVLTSKSIFLENLKNGICQMDPKPRRELVPEKLEVFPLKNQGKLYGALQRGVHKFFLTPEGKEEIMTSIAKFSHLWLLEEGEWKLAQVYSFDHQSP